MAAVRHGGGKQKGASFERVVCKKLSLWVTRGAKEDCFWRSAMSGGRATVARQRGVDVRQAGDICAVAPEGHVLTDRWFVEVKHYKRLDLAKFLIGLGILASFWRIASEQAALHGRVPMVIARQNLFPTLILVRRYNNAWIACDPSASVQIDGEFVDVYLFDMVMQTKFAPTWSNKALRKEIARRPLKQD